jgi:hypothetical protein
MYRTPSNCKTDTPMCVEVDTTGSKWIKVRNTQAPEVIAYFTHDEWRTFIDGVKRGEFDIPTPPRQRPQVVR